MFGAEPFAEGRRVHEISAFGGIETPTGSCLYRLTSGRKTLK